MGGFSGGVYSRFHDWEADRVAGLDITDTRMDAEDDGFAAALSMCILKDGTQTITADLPMASHRITNLADGTLDHHAINLGQANARYVQQATPVMSGALTITSTSANALAVGPAGITNPALSVHAAVAGATTGIQILGYTAGQGAYIDVTSSAANETLWLRGKGTSGVTIGGPLAAGVISSGSITVTGNISLNGTVTAGALTTGGTCTVASLTISSTSPTITFQDNDWGNRIYHNNSGNSGIMRGDASKWLYYIDASENFNVGGQITATGNVVAYSDERLKTDVVTIANALDLVRRMRGVRFWRTDRDEAGAGVVAQELDEVAPELVDRNSEWLGVAYGNLVGYLIEAIKTLADEVDELREARA